MMNVQNIIDRIREIMDDETLIQLKDELNSYHVADLADIFQELKPEERLQCFKLLDLEKDDEGYYTKGTDDLFALLIIMKRMLSYDEFKDMCLELEKRIDNLDYNLHSIKIDKILDKMGFPSNYMELANIERRDVDEFREN